MESMRPPIDARAAGANGRHDTAADVEMLVDEVDSSDRIIGTVKRREIFRRGANFRVVHVFLFNNRHELLLQLIAPGLRHSGQWGSSAAGYVRSGELYETAAARKLHTEVGVVATLNHFGTTWMLDGGVRKFIGLFVGFHDGPILPNPSDVSAVDFISLPAVAAERSSRRRVFTPTFEHLIDFYQGRHPGP